MEAITESIQREARRLLQEEAVDVIIGYQLGWDGVGPVPAFFAQPDQVDKLVYNERCTHNLAKYLVGREGYLTSRFRPSDQTVRVGLVAHPATMRTIVALLREYQFDRADLTILGIVDGTPVGLEPDIAVGRVEVDSTKEEQIRAQIEELDRMSLAERGEWWREQFGKCIRCYACRQVCPFCYCEQCVADENQPQWVERSPTDWNNTAWNLIRAYHLTGRCSGCGECDRVCPVDIPLRLLNTKMGEEVQAAFGFVAGTDPDADPALAAFQPNDTAAFVR
jgi:formate dehydrogenase subunit beta